MRRRIKIFFDGGCRPNPGPIETAVVLKGVAHIRQGQSPGSNEDAEWLALLAALEICRSGRIANAELVGDALFVIKQANATLVRGEATSDHESRFLTLVREVQPCRIRWIKREQNLAGIALARLHPR